MQHVPCNFCRQDDTELLFTKKEKFGLSDSEFHVVRCRRCGLVYVNPRPGPEEIAGFYPETYSWKETLAAESALTQFIRTLEKKYRYHLLHYEVSKVLRTTGKQSGKVLDVGCGAGDRLDIFRQRNFEVYGVEISQAATYAREHLGLDVKQGDIFDAAYPDSFFDIITLHNVLEHTHDPAKVLAELSRIVKEDGFIIIQVPNIHCLQYKLFGKRWAAVDVPRDLYYFSEMSLRAMLQQTGLEIRHVDHFHNWWHPPTLVISLWPALDPQFAWRSEASRSSAYFRRLLWGALTCTVSVFTLFESLLGRGAIMTFCASKSRREVQK